MNRTDCAVLVNTCPKYFYMLEPCFGLLRRYGEGLQWPVYLATEVPKDPTVVTLCKRYNVQILDLPQEDSAFLQSRVKGIELLPKSIRYVLPLQEDFLLERPGLDEKALTHALEILDVDQQVQSLRLMPCPGSSAREGFWGVWKKLGLEDLHFSYQATLWRRELLCEYFRAVVRQGQAMYPELEPTSAEWNQYCVRTNPAETLPGLSILKRMAPDAVHLCWPRKGSWANAVYMCPWPYRPTAIVQGVLQPWAKELIQREGFILRTPV